MSDPVLQRMAAIPEGRMLVVRVLETGLRTGLSYDKAAAKARVSSSTASNWAGQLNIRKCDLAAETPAMRRARHESWALALAALGRMDEAAAWEGEARRLETTLRRIGDREADAAAADETPAPDLVFLGRVAGTLADRPAEPGLARLEAWSAVFDYFSRLREMGAVPSPDGQVTWPDGPPAGLPPTPAWLPCDPWAVEDVEAWEALVGEALRML